MNYWGIHRICDIYQPGVQAGLPDGRWVVAVPLPYQGNVFERLRAAWCVFRERAYALEWPKAGDLESALNVEPQTRRPMKGQQSQK